MDYTICVGTFKDKEMSFVISTSGLVFSSDRLGFGFLLSALITMSCTLSSVQKFALKNQFGHPWCVEICVSHNCLDISQLYSHRQNFFLIASLSLPSMLSGQSHLSKNTLSTLCLLIQMLYPHLFALPCWWWHSVALGWVGPVSLLVGLRAKETCLAREVSLSWTRLSKICTGLQIFFNSDTLSHTLSYILWFTFRKYCNQQFLCKVDSFWTNLTTSLWPKEINIWIKVFSRYNNWPFLF